MAVNAVGIHQDFEQRDAARRRQIPIAAKSFRANRERVRVAFQADGLLELHPDKITVTVPGRLLIRNIVMNFDAYLQRKEGKKPQFSRTV